MRKELPRIPVQPRYRLQAPKPRHLRGDRLDPIVKNHRSEQPGIWSGSPGNGRLRIEGPPR